MKRLVTILLLFVAFFANGQSITYTPMTAGGYAFKYLKADSGFAVPFRNLTTGRGVVRPGSIIINEVDSLFYGFDGVAWNPIGIGAGTVTGFVDSVTINGNNLFYWIGGLGTGRQINKIDSIRQSEGTDSIWTFIGGDSTFVYRNATGGGSGSVTEVTSSTSDITVTFNTTTPVITLDTSKHHSYAFLQTVFAAFSHVHNAADITSGTLPLARGGTGMSGIGSVAQQIRVAASGTALEYFTPTASGSDSAFVRHANINDTTLRLYRFNGDSSDVLFTLEGLGGGGGGAWGTITGTLSDQTDLQAALDAKQDDITLTTTGTSGAATFAANVLNIPNYAGGGGVTTLAAIGAVPNANAASISGSTLNMQPADTSFGGVVTTLTQEFKGKKSFWIPNGDSFLVRKSGSLNYINLDAGLTGVSPKLTLFYSGATAGTIGYTALAANTALNLSMTTEVAGTMRAIGLTSGSSLAAMGQTVITPALGGQLILGPATGNAFINFSQQGAFYGWVAGMKTSSSNDFVFSSTPSSWTAFDGTEVMRLKRTTYNVLIGTSTDNSKLTVNGSFAPAYIAKTATYTATISDYTIDCTANTFTVTLPTAVGISGRVYIIKNSGAGVITVATTSSQTIDGAATVSLATQYKYVTVQSNNANWIIIGND